MSSFKRCKKENLLKKSLTNSHVLIFLFYYETLYLNLKDKLKPGIKNFTVLSVDSKISIHDIEKAHTNRREKIIIPIEKKTQMATKYAQFPKK